MRGKKIKFGDKVNKIGEGRGVITKIDTDILAMLPYFVNFENGKSFWCSEEELELHESSE